VAPSAKRGVRLARTLTGGGGSAKANNRRKHLQDRGHLGVLRGWGEERTRLKHCSSLKDMPKVSAQHQAPNLLSQAVPEHSVVEAAQMNRLRDLQCGAIDANSETPIHTQQTS
jgi:hypothetical protein